MISVPFLNSNHCGAGVGQFRDELEGVQNKLDAIDKRMKELTTKAKSARSRPMSKANSGDVGRVRGTHDLLTPRGLQQLLS